MQLCAGACAWALAQFAWPGFGPVCMARLSVGSLRPLLSDGRRQQRGWRSTPGQVFIPHLASNLSLPCASPCVALPRFRRQTISLLTESAVGIVVIRIGGWSPARPGAPSPSSSGAASTRLHPHGTRDDSARHMLDESCLRRPHAGQRALAGRIRRSGQGPNPELRAAPFPSVAPNRPCPPSTPISVYTVRVILGGGVTPVHVHPPRAPFSPFLCMLPSPPFPSMRAHARDELHLIWWTYYGG